TVCWLKGLRSRCIPSAPSRGLAVESMRAAGQHVDDEVLTQIFAAHKINFFGFIGVDTNNQR
ncbi:MAG: hypothetical protein LC721_03835, partial [Actinobacteria bacterium]|nr:hypothetical protein [Actinomycetota bacterium]